MRGRTGTALLVLATCCGIQSAVAQRKAGQSRTSFGIVGGLNLAKFTGSDVSSGIKTRTAFYGGVAATVPLGSTLFLQPQAIFSMQGYSASVTGGSGTFKLDYVQIPMFLGLRIPMQGSGMHPYLMAGPYLGLKVGCKISASGSGVSGSMNCDDPSVALDMKGTDFGLGFGAGVEVPMGTGTLSLGARFSMGLSEVVTGSNAKNSVISFGLGYFFGGGR